MTIPTSIRCRQPVKHHSHGNCLFVAKLRTQDNGLPKFRANSCVLSSPTSEVDEVSGWLWQLVTAIHDENDGPTICDRVSQRLFMTAFMLP
jgi:hypothetical protein